MSKILDARIILSNGSELPLRCCLYTHQTRRDRIINPINGTHDMPLSNRKNSMSDSTRMTSAGKNRG